jgi:YD repeat-containing protein
MSAPRWTGSFDRQDPSGVALKKGCMNHAARLLLVSISLLGCGAARKVPARPPAETCKEGDLPDCTARCDHGEMRSCTTLGSMFATGANAPHDGARARALYQRACDAGNPLGCYGLGLAYAQGTGGPRDVRKAADIFQRACSDTMPEACTSAGLLYTTGEGMPVDYARAFVALKRGCDANSTLGCTGLGMLYLHGQGVDDLGRLREVLAEGQGEVTIHYTTRVAEENGHLVGVSISRSDAMRGVVRTDLDVLGRPVGGGHTGFDGTWIEQSLRYDPLGRVIEVSRPGFGAPGTSSTRTVYDNLDRRKAEISPDLQATVFDQAFFTTQVTDPMGHVRTVVRDVDDRIVKSIESADGPAIVTEFHHDAFDQVDRITDTKGNAIEVRYDHRGRRAAIHDPDAGPTELFYNGFGDLKTTVRGASVTHQTYDLLGRPTQVDDADGTATYVWDTSPHGTGSLAHTRSADGTTQDFFYDALARLKTQRWTVEGKAFELERTYDSMGRAETLAYPEVPNYARFTVRQTYTDTSYVKGIVDATAWRSFWQADSLNSDDQLLQATLGNGLTSQRGYDQTTGRLTSLIEGSALALGYAYDRDGQVWHRDDAIANRSETFSYDGLHRLKRWAQSTHIPVPRGFPGAQHTFRETTYHYDDLGNVIQAAVKGVPGQDSVYGAEGRPHALSSNAQGAYFYDDRGRQTVAPGRTVDFTEFDLPRTITAASGVTHFLYDAGHARVKKEGPTGTVVSLGGLYERRESGGKTQHVFYVQGGEGPVAQVVVEEGVPGSTTTYLHRDPLGSVGAVTDKNGVVQQRLFYEPFGARRDVDVGPSGTPPPADVPLGFTGQRHDDELGLIDFGGRVYGAPVKTGRRKQVREEEMATKVLTKQVLPWEGAPPQEAESCVGRGDPAGEA